MTTLPAAGAAGAANSTGIAYLRCAVAAGEPDLSLQAQRATIHAWADRHSIRILAWHEDRGVSGLSRLEERPGLSAALAELKATRAEALLVARWDRVARDPRVIDDIYVAVRQAGARIVCACTVCADDAATISSLAVGAALSALDEATALLKLTDCPDGCPCACHGDEEDIPREHHPGCLWGDPDFFPYV